MKKNNKGFTLIESLTVIIIVSVVALISIPKINEIIKNSKTQADKNSINSLVTAIKNELAANDYNSEITYNLPITNTSKFIEIKATNLNGQITIDKDSKIRLAVKMSNNICAIKSFGDDDITYTTNDLTNNCDINITNNLISNGFFTKDISNDFVQISDIIYNDTLNEESFIANYNPNEKTVTLINSPSKLNALKQYIPIDISKKYRLSFTSYSGYNKIGFLSYDNSKKIILNKHTLYNPNTTTSLMADFNSYQTTMKLGNVSNYTNYNCSNLIFWNYVDDFGNIYPTNTYSRNVFNINISNVDKINNILNFTSYSTNNMSIPKGTRVSCAEYYNGDNEYKNIITSSASQYQDGFSKYETIIDGVMTSSYNDNQFKNGTKYIRIFFPNYVTLKNVVLQEIE